MLGGWCQTHVAHLDDPQAQAVAEIIQRTRPEVLLINEFDYDPAALEPFQDRSISSSTIPSSPRR